MGIFTTTDADLNNYVAISNFKKYIVCDSRIVDPGQYIHIKIVKKDIIVRFSESFQFTVIDGDYDISNYDKVTFEHPHGKIWIQSVAFKRLPYNIVCGTIEFVGNPAPISNHYITLLGEHELVLPEKVVFNNVSLDCVKNRGTRVIKNHKGAVSKNLQIKGFYGLIIPDYASQTQIKRALKMHEFAGIKFDDAIHMIQFAERTCWRANSISNDGAIYTVNTSSGDWYVF